MSNRINKTATFDLIVVGAGILGLSAAIQAAQHGLKVCLFEKDAEAVGATRRNFGMIGTSTLAHPETQWREYALKTRTFYQAIQLQTDISLRSRASLYLANNPLQWQVLNEFAQAAQDYQINANVLSPAQLQTQFNYLNPAAAFQGGLMIEGDYSIEPTLIGKQLLEVAQHLGVEIYCHACVIQTRSQPNYCEAQLASGAVFQAHKILICHGDAVNILYPDLLQKLGLKRCALQMLLTQPFSTQMQADLYSGLSISRYPAFEICPSHRALQQQLSEQLVIDYGIHILIKQNARGELIVGDSHEYHPIDAAPQFQQREQVNQYIQDYCHSQMGLRLPSIQQRWMGYYLSHDSEMACVTEAEKHIYLVSAIAGKGMTTGPGFIQEVLEQHIF